MVDSQGRKLTKHRIQIGDEWFHSRNPLIIAEVAQAHDGSLGTAHAYIDAVAKTGAQCIKFQTHIADAESGPDEPWRVRFGYQDKSRFDYWKRMEFTEEQWAGLREHAERSGLIFLSSPFSVEAVNLLCRVGMPAWKIASGEVGNQILLDRILETRLPVLLSSGMSSLEEVESFARRVRHADVALLAMQCTSIYPCPPEKVGLNVMRDLQEVLSCPVGLSDHSGTIYPSLAAATMGASAIEVHVTLAREMFGPDVCASVTISELKTMVEGVKFINAMLNNDVSKDEMVLELCELRKIFTKSVCVRRKIEAGEALAQDSLGLRKPGTGIPATQLSRLYGKKVVRDIEAGTILTEADLGGAI